MYLLGIPDWLFWWGFVALMLALLLLAGNLCLTEDSAKEHFKCFFYSLSCFLPCLWCPICCYVFCLDQTKCKLCGKEVWNIIDHRIECREKSAFAEIPDSSLYHCQNCDTHLKVWPVSKVQKMDCVSLECFEKVINNHQNIHLCFICDKMVCDKHNRTDQRINVDLSNPESLIRDVGTSEDGSQSDNSDTGGFTDQRRRSIPDGSNFFPSDPSVSPTFDTSSPSAPPPTYGSGYTPLIQPYASPTNTFDQPHGQPMPNPDLNSYNLPQKSDDLFPDLPPSYEVAMMDETDMC